MATALFAATAAYALLGWHFTRSSWAFNADPPARHILISADRSFHEIGWVLVGAGTVGAAATGLALWRGLSDRVRAALLAVGMVAVMTCYAGDLAASHVNTHQPCACDDSVGMTP